MKIAEKLRTILRVAAVRPGVVAVQWKRGPKVELAVGHLLGKNGARKKPVSRDSFASVAVGAWGHSLVWDNGQAISAERLWLETLSAMGCHDARGFLEWRLRHALSLTKAAETLGVSRRTVAHYSDGAHAVPKAVRMACRAVDAAHALSLPPPRDGAAAFQRVKRAMALGEVSRP